MFFVGHTMADNQLIMQAEEADLSPRLFDEVYEMCEVIGKYVSYLRIIFIKLKNCFCIYIYGIPEML